MKKNICLRGDLFVPLSGNNYYIFLSFVFSSRTGTEKKKRRPVNDSETGLIPYIVLAICLAVFLLLAVILGALHYKGKLPQACYNWKGGKKFQPVNGTNAEAEDAEVRTSIKT